MLASVFTHWVECQVPTCKFFHFSPYCFSHELRKWFLIKAGNKGLYKMLADFPDKSAHALCLFCYCAGPGEPVHTFEGRTEGRIVSPRGPQHFGWDPIFEPEGFDKTYAELPSEVKNVISHRRRALYKVHHFLP